jgi:hypothetical protein
LDSITFYNGSPVTTFDLTVHLMVSLLWLFCATKCYVNVGKNEGAAGFYGVAAFFIGFLAVITYAGLFYLGWQLVFDVGWHKVF